MKLTILFLLLSFCVSAQKIQYTINNGLQIEGVDGTNPVILDNDMILDTPELFYLWLKANRGQLNLVGNINTRNLFIPPNVLPQNTHESTFQEWTRAYNAAISSGLKNIPQPIKGADWYLTKPSTGVIEQTVRKDSPGSDLIISEALKASPSKPLIIIVGGQATSVANAYLKNPTIIDRVIVFHVDGWGSTQFNGVDYWANEIVMRRMKYINWDGNLNSWYTVDLNFSAAGIPNNAFTSLYMGNYYNHVYQLFKDIGDGPPASYLFNHSLFRNVVRKNAANQTVTADNFDFLLISDNNWDGLGKEIGDFIRNPQSYIPGATTPPVNQSPVVMITNGASFMEGAITLTANASDPDGTVARVDFKVNGVIVGQDSSTPYAYNWNAGAGTYQITATVVDNLAANATSSPLTITVTGIVIPPDSTNCDCPAGPKGDKGDKGDQGIQGIQGPIGNCTGCPSGGGGSQTKNTFDVTAYGANPNDNVNDLGAFQAAYDAARGVAGKVIIPSPGGGTYYLDGTWNIIPDGSNQVWVDVEMVGGRAGTIRYRGPSNQPVVRIVGLKGALWTGLNIAIEDGRSGVQLFDIDTTPSAGSSSFVTFKTFYCNLGNGQNNSAFRLGHNSGGGADISNYQWENCIVFGGGKLGSSGLVEAIPGQIAYHVEGNNTLSQTWIGGFVAGCDRIFSNKNGAGAKVDRGNGSVFFYGLGSSQNNIDYDINFEQNYLIIGGRYESSNSILTTATHSFHSAITFQDIQFNDYKSDHLFDVNTAATLYIKNCRMNKKSGALNDLVRCSAQGGAGTITIESGGTNAVNLIRQDGGGTFKKYVRGVGKFSDVNGVFIGSHYPDQNGN